MQQSVASLCFSGFQSSDQSGTVVISIPPAGLQYSDVAGCLDLLVARLNRAITVGFITAELHDEAYYCLCRIMDKRFVISCFCAQLKTKLDVKFVDGTPPLGYSIPSMLISPQYSRTI